MDVANGYFSADVVTTGIENELDPDANTYCIIGAIDPADYLFADGYYSLKLMYWYDDGTSDTLEWTQTSWITESTITGADLSSITTDLYINEGCREFFGLGLSQAWEAYLDGNAYDSSQCWFHAIASVSCILHSNSW